MPKKHSSIVLKLELTGHGRPRDVSHFNWKSFIDPLVCQCVKRDSYFGRSQHTDSTS